MTIEITRPGGTHQYRQREDDPCVIESRNTKPGSRWAAIRDPSGGRYDTAEEARAALLRIGRGQLPLISPPVRYE